MNRRQNRHSYKIDIKRLTRSTRCSLFLSGYALLARSFLLNRPAAADSFPVSGLNNTVGSITSAFKNRPAMLSRLAEYYECQPEDLQMQVDIQSFLPVCISASKSLDLCHENLRFCRLCLRAGDHYAFQQLPWLYECPLHQIPIEDSCPNCRENVNADSLRDVYLHPYQCACGYMFADIGAILSKDESHTRIAFEKNLRRHMESCASKCFYLEDYCLESDPSIEESWVIAANVLRIQQKRLSKFSSVFLPPKRVEWVKKSIGNEDSKYFGTVLKDYCCQAWPDYWPLGVNAAKTMHWTVGASTAVLESVAFLMADEVSNSYVPMHCSAVDALSFRRFLYENLVENERAQAVAYFIDINTIWARFSPPVFDQRNSYAVRHKKPQSDAYWSWMGSVLAIAGPYLLADIAQKYRRQNKRNSANNEFDESIAPLRHIISTKVLIGAHEYVPILFSTCLDDVRQVVRPLLLEAWHLSLDADPDPWETHMNRAHEKMILSRIEWSYLHYRSLREEFLRQNATSRP